jgi:hypothetical protein
MDSLIYLLKSTTHNIPMIGGAVFCMLVMSIFFFFKFNIREKTSQTVGKLCGYSTFAFFFLFVLIGTIYLFYPNYLNHVEPTVASLGVVMRSGDFLYPLPVGSYPYNGILYGPALFEIQAIFQCFGLSTLVSSKLPGLIAFIFSGLILLRLNKNLIYRGYLLYLFPFGLMLFWNRAEPLLLLIVSFSLLLGNKYSNNKYLPILMGILGGAASAMKMHGAAYVFAAYLATVLSAGVSIFSIILFFIFSVLSFFAFFIPQNVSFIAFWGYLKLAGTNHGLSFRLWLESFVYLVFLIFPFLLFWRRAKAERFARIILFLILGIEFCITIVAAKRGNGFYHLLPLIPINAFIITKINKNEANGNGLINVLYVSLIFISLLTVLLDFVLPMAKSWRQFSDAKKEVVYFERKYTGMMMGVTNNNEYPYSFLRVILRNRQIDYAAYMDFQISGINDDTLVEDLKTCKINFVLLSNNRAFFSMNNYYTGKALFSEKVREAFAYKYKCAENGRYYSVYTCSDSAKRVSKRFSNRLIIFDRN